MSIQSTSSTVIFNTMRDRRHFICEDKIGLMPLPRLNKLGRFKINRLHSFRDELNLMVGDGIREVGSSRKPDLNFIEGDFSTSAFAGCREIVHALN